MIYPCACSRKEIAESALAGVEGLIYPGTCRDAIPDARAARALRFDTRGAVMIFDDGLLGPQRRDLERELGDFVVYRTDGVYGFHLASAVDDGELGITHVVRGVDLLESSARQLHVLRVLGLPIPRYVHLPIAVDANGEKLSKQTRAAAIEPARPLVALKAVWEFLNQGSAADLADLTLPDFWRYAIAHCDLRRVARRREAPVPGMA